MGHVYRSRTRARIGVLSIISLVVTMVPMGVLPAVASDNLVITVDVDGPDDVPLQEDVTQMGFDTSHLFEADPYYSVFFSFDDVAMTGGNSGDGCAFFDADGDGFADFAMCVRPSKANRLNWPPPRCTTARTPRTPATRGLVARPQAVAATARVV